MNVKRMIALTMPVEDYRNNIKDAEFRVNEARASVETLVNAAKIDTENIRTELEDARAGLSMVSDGLNAIIGMWDALGTIPRATVARLLPNLATKLEELRAVLNAD